ncbi:MAG: F0F1 ATP synthase subunit B [Candidatus Poribacteria bacterium]|nr:F0F1 ATP synthase subunit B [Candidatus Poribacteria bacterium]
MSPITAFAAEAGGDGLLGAIGIDPMAVILQALGFLIVLLVLWKFVFGRVGGLLEERQNDIASRMDKLEADQRELDRLTAETQQRLNEIGAESQAKIQAAIEEGNAERQNILNQARQDAAAELERARDEIQREKEEAILELRGIVAEIAIDAASKIIDQTLDVEGHRHIIDESIRRIPDAPLRSQ